MSLQRIEALRALFPAWQCDVLIIEAPIDLYYLTGLRLSAGRLLIGIDSAQLFVDGRYLAIAQEKSPVPVAPLEKKHQRAWLERVGGKRIGFDSASMSYDQYSKCAEIFDKTMLPIVSPLKTLRMIKDPEEREKMRKSAALAKEGVRHLCRALASGITEKEMAWQFEKFCRERGAASMAFAPIIAFGENTSFPHHRSSERPYKEGEPVLIDVGCIMDDYASDVSRTLWSAEVAPQFSHLHEIVVRSQKAALAICRPGISIGELDAAARRVMREAGVEELFVHGLGHGIGLETHEFPRISLKAEERDLLLQEGMVITIEPGLYVAGVCGARHEDTVIVTNEGPENLYGEIDV